MVTESEATVGSVRALGTVGVGSGSVVSGQATTGIPAKPVRLRVGEFEPGDMKKKLVCGMRTGNGIHGNDAGGDHIGVIDVGVAAPDFRGDGFILKPRRVDEAVAP